MLIDGIERAGIHRLYERRDYESCLLGQRVACDDLALGAAGS